MAWIVLIVSALLEAVWATALGYSHGFSEPLPSIVFAVAFLASVLGLGWAAKSIPIGTAYTAWVGVGAALTVVYAMAAGDEPVSIPKLIFIAGIVGAAAGLKALSGRTHAVESRDDSGH